MALPMFFLQNGKYLLEADFVAILFRVFEWLIVFDYATKDPRSVHQEVL